MSQFSNTLPLSPKKIARCREIARMIGKNVSELVRENSTVGIERGVLRLVGFNDAKEGDGLLYPVSNKIIDQLKDRNRLGEGALYWVSNALLNGANSVDELQKKLIEGFDLSTLPEKKRRDICKVGNQLAKKSLTNLLQYRKNRLKLKNRFPKVKNRPLKYVIVATGNIYEDVTQARAAVLDGAEIIAVIRSTAQSLIDYVPQGTTREGFGGTYATQGNFKLMREALDDLSREVGRYIGLTNYCSGLCMSEIAVLASMEGLDYLLNDAMYGILFRDINMRRTLIDQHFSRLICGSSNIVIMTGEDNYLKTTDAVESGDQVLASQFINERAALNAGMKTHQMAIGHAMEMDPSYSNVILMEVARAQMTRQIFKDSPLKYMCNTKYKTGDIFTSHAIDTVFNFIGGITGQGILLLGMPTEAIHTPFMHDRSLSIRSSNYVLGGLDTGSEFGFNKNGFMARFAEKVLDDALSLLEKVERTGFYRSIEQGTFAGVKRKIDGGKGREGVFQIEKERYFNPFYQWLGSKI